MMNQGAGYRMQHSVFGAENFSAPCAPPRAPLPRSGISLMEVLVSIGIVAIGLVSIASLIPVGGLQAQKADQIQRQSDVGLDAIREFTTRGLAVVDPQDSCHWVRTSGSTGKAYFPLDLDPMHSPNDSAFCLPVAIDPLMVAAAAGNNAVKAFPANAASSAPIMQRLSLKEVSTTSGAAPNFTYNPIFALADAIFRSTDDVIVDQPSDRSLPGTSSYFNDTSTTPAKPLKRASGGLYSWMATVTPYYPVESSIEPVAGMQCTLSIAVFYRRSLPSPTATFDPTTVHESIVEVTLSGAPAPNASQDYTSLGGVEAILKVTNTSGLGTSANPNPLAYAKPGNWLMLCQSRPNGSGSYPDFKWYRVTNGDAVEDTSATATANVTLTGPDWQFAKADSPKTYACLFDGIVAVYQKMIQLEGSSPWSQ
jgi:type II secretory pathway pseudopilin PulG